MVLYQARSENGEPLTILARPAEDAALRLLASVQRQVLKTRSSLVFSSTETGEALDGGRSIRTGVFWPKLMDHIWTTVFHSTGWHHSRYRQQNVLHCHKLLGFITTGRNRSHKCWSLGQSPQPPLFATTKNQDVRDDELIPPCVCHGKDRRWRCRIATREKNS